MCAGWLATAPCGAKAEEDGGDAPPEELKDGESGGRLVVGAQEGGCAIQGCGKGAGPLAKQGAERPGESATRHL